MNDKEKGLEVCRLFDSGLESKCIEEKTGMSRAVVERLKRDYKEFYLAQDHVLLSALRPCEKLSSPHEMA